MNDPEIMAIVMQTDACGGKSDISLWQTKLCITNGMYQVANYSVATGFTDIDLNSVRKR